MGAEKWWSGLCIGGEVINRFIAFWKYLHQEWPEKNKDIVFLVVWESGTGADDPMVELCAPGYGQIGDYGAGSIFAKLEDVVEEKVSEQLEV